MAGSGQSGGNFKQRTDAGDPNVQFAKKLSQNPFQNGIFQTIDTSALVGWNEIRHGLGRKFTGAINCGQSFDYGNFLIFCSLPTDVTDPATFIKIYVPLVLAGGKLNLFIF